MTDQSILILTATDIERLLPMSVCIDLMATTLADLERGELHQPLRTIVRPENARGVMGLMPSYRQGDEVSFGLKAICVFPGNPKRGLDAHQGGVLLFSGETGELQGVFNASAITAIRTAAVSGVATRLLARDDAGELTVFGAGVQARVHLDAMAAVRPLKRVRVVSRNPDHGKQFASEMAAKFPFPVEPHTNAEEALDGSDLIVTCTNSKEPVLRREWISEGAHINAVGACIPTAREIDSATMAAARLFVDRRESALNEAGDYLLAAKDGVISAESLEAEIGELLAGKKEGRRTANELTLFKSLGIAVEDLASAEYLLKKATEQNFGTRVAF
jgi:ornithine cyclodeaminase